MVGRKSTPTEGRSHEPPQNPEAIDTDVIETESVTAAPAEAIAEDLVEEVSIDGMCGVY